ESVGRKFARRFDSVELVQKKSSPETTVKKMSSPLSDNIHLSHSLPENEKAMRERIDALSPTKRAVLEMKRNNIRLRTASNVRIQRKSGSSRRRLSYAQERLWF